jgi:DnaK suppressor protein
LEIEKGETMMTKGYSQYRMALEAKAAELERALRNRGLIAIETAPEECERMVLATQRDLSVVTLDRNSRLLEEVRAALERIEKEDFGICESCDEEIKPKRLAAVPWARFCIRCQERLDPGPSADESSYSVLFQTAA